VSSARAPKNSDQVDRILTAVDRITHDDIEQLAVHIRRGDLALVHTYEMLVSRNARIVAVVLEALL